MTRRFVALILIFLFLLPLGLFYRTLLGERGALIMLAAIIGGAVWIVIHGARREKRLLRDRQEGDHPEEPGG